MISSATGISNISPAYMQANTGNGSKPKKYVKIDGVTQLNPEYTRWQNGHGQQTTSVADPNVALPVVTNMEDHQEIRQVSQDAGYGDVALAPATDATIAMMQDEEVCLQVGLDSDELVDGLGAVFARYEAPMGLMNKLMCLSEYHEMEFLVDDSGSMGCKSDTTNLQGQWQTRWEEARGRLKNMMEVLAYVPTPKITIRFLNRANVVNLVHNGQTPDNFLTDAYQKIDAAFYSRADGMTPFKERIEESLQRGRGQRVARYFFGDGTPNGGASAIKAIEAMVKNRENPEGNPITFLSCTNQDDEVEWMKELEEVAPYCAEYDDFKDEAEEVRRDQGDALPFTRGFHLVGQLVAAMNPDDLDAMDESVPFTKWSLDNLLGIKTSDQEYRHYFDQFKVAQHRRVCENQMDVIKAKQNWEPDYHLFVSTHVAKTIPSVVQFKARLAAANK